MSPESQRPGRNRVGKSIVDLSAPIAPSPPETPAWQRTDIEYVNHAGGAAGGLPANPRDR